MIYNLVFQDRFNGTLSEWTLSESGGTVSIATVDYSPKMKLDDTSGSSNVSATRSFTPPVGDWILEYDMYHASSSQGVMELLDSSDNVIATADLGGTTNTFSFSTNDVAASTTTWNSGVYKQVVIVVHSGDMACYISGDDGTYSPLSIVGSAKSFTGTVGKIRFRTGTTKQGTVYVDEVRVYSPGLFIIGDSISDGKLHWSTHPAYPDGRLGAGEDETGSPAQLLSDKWGNTWISNRAYGGSYLFWSSPNYLLGIDGHIQEVVIDHYATDVYIGAGHNDIYPGITSLSEMQSAMNSIITKLQNAGITGNHIILGNVAPSDLISGAGTTLRNNWNSWLQSRATEVGALYVDNATNLYESSGDPNTLKSSYDSGDGTHPNKLGSGAIADGIYDVLPTQTTTTTTTTTTTSTTTTSTTTTSTTTTTTAEPTTTTTSTTTTTTATPTTTTTSTTTTTTTLAPVAQPSTKSLNILTSDQVMLEFGDVGTVEQGIFVCKYDTGKAYYKLIEPDDDHPVRVNTSLGVRCLD
jgi:hypothetical protein